MTTNKLGSVNQVPHYGCTSCISSYEDCMWPAGDLRVHGSECWCYPCWDERRWDFPDQPCWNDLEPYTPAPQPAPDVQGPVEPEIEPYDAGFLNDFGGGNVGWWHDYIRDELDRAYEFYLDQLAAAPHPAPNVAGLVFCEDAALTIAERTFSTEVDEQLAEDAIQYARRLHELYAAPQPAPDVTQLVEALETIQKVAIHKSIHTDTQAEIALGGIAVICDAALAAYRKGGEV